jgi:uncharacterized protein
MREIHIPLRDLSVTASVHGEGETAVILGHGAGGNRKTGFLLRLAERLSSGRQAILYNFPYTERRRRLPDPPEILEAAVRAVGDHALAHLGARRLVHGGKSMGGRMASQSVAKGAPADALVFLGYPLHPPGRPEALRDRHLPQVAQPMLFVQGTRDAFARWDLVEPLVLRLGATLYKVEDGDHSFAVPKRLGRSADEIEEGISGAILDWLDARGL